MAALVDRNFDGLAAKFARKIYSSYKGEVRLAVIWRDLEASFTAAARPLQGPAARPLRVLDIGGGLGQFSCRLAALGHRITYNDLSTQMLELAQRSADESGCADNIEWRPGSYQPLVAALAKRDERYDLILCHAVIEWLAAPQRLAAELAPLLAERGVLSLSYYNRHGWEYRNLLRGNFNLLDRPYRAEPGSLTPHHAFTQPQVAGWLAEQRLQIERSSGIRVFSDYAGERRGGLADPAAVVARELERSSQEPFKWLGRYIHLIATAAN